ncbi:hypothetical protein NW762_005486 [Fusarium torreyae]|uniref:C2H2-type domain-containing protein n=1 Tax=Fusarium torreyae TaxID=1237075 RepID=A0A9W8VI71_9HYPO|nr:hypothetical protein NW762_005486 [Fusarium torreyae]
MSAHVGLVPLVVATHSLKFETDTKEKPYRCPCGRSFSRRDLLTRHSRLSHDGRLPTQQSSTSSIQTPPSPGMPTISSDYTTDQTSASGTFGTLDTQSSIQPDTPTVDPDNGCVEAMQDLSEFLNTVGFDLDLDVELLYPSSLLQCDSEADAGSIPTDINTSPAMAETSTSATHISPDMTAARANITDDHWLSSYEHGYGQHIESRDGYQPIKTFTQPWKITEHQRIDFQHHLEPYSSALEGFIVPSRVTMSRYFAGYIEGFSHHHPVIHIPTFSITNYNQTPELVMAIMAIGAQYRYEHLGGLALYRASRAIIFHRREIQQRDRHNANTSDQGETQSQSPFYLHHGAETLGALLLLAKFASWQRDERLVEEAIEYQYLLAKHARETGFSETEADDGDDWWIWAHSSSPDE